MHEGNLTAFEAVSEAEFEPVLKLLQGGDPDVIARRANLTKNALFRMRDNLLARADCKKNAAHHTARSRPGRNDPCPCGSGKKYKRCCLGKDETLRRSKVQPETGFVQASVQEQETLIQSIETAFRLMASRQYDEAIRFASKLLRQYPNEDRLHDILAVSQLYAGDCDAAVDICKRRMDVAASEKSYFIRHGRYRDAEANTPALSYYYPPLTWMQKYWTALKAGDYEALRPEKENATITALVQTLQSADDPQIFPEKHSQGLELRRAALNKTLEALKSVGPEAIPYIMPLACRYSWAGLFTPEIISAYETRAAVRGLIDISMFGFAYASGASLHFLEKGGEAVVPFIEAAFSRDILFDPIKTGIVSVLGNIRGPAAYDLLLRLLEHQSKHIVNWAGGALGKFKAVEALPAMVAANERIGGQKMLDAAIDQLKDLSISACEKHDAAPDIEKRNNFQILV